MKSGKELTETEADSGYDTNNFILQMRRHHCNVITKLQCCNRHQQKMGATNVDIQLLAEAMCITRSVISLPTLLQYSEYHPDKFRTWKRHLYQLLPHYEEKQNLGFIL